MFSWRALKLNRHVTAEDLTAQNLLREQTPPSLVRTVAEFRRLREAERLLAITQYYSCRKTATRGW